MNWRPGMPPDDIPDNYEIYDELCTPDDRIVAVLACFAHNPTVYYCSALTPAGEWMRLGGGSNYDTTRDWAERVTGLKIDRDLSGRRGSSLLAAAQLRADLVFRERQSVVSSRNDSCRHQGYCVHACQRSERKYFQLFRGGLDTVGQCVRRVHLRERLRRRHIRTLARKRDSPSTNLDDDAGRSRWSRLFRLSAGATKHRFCCCLMFASRARHQLGAAFRRPALLIGALLANPTPPFPFAIEKPRPVGFWPGLRQMRHSPSSPLGDRHSGPNITPESIDCGDVSARLPPL